MIHQRDEEDKIQNEEEEAIRWSSHLYHSSSDRIPMAIYSCYFVVIRSYTSSVEIGTIVFADEMYLAKAKYLSIDSNIEAASY